ncbi:MAG: Hsp20/alpha crystallin family protein [Candidatus Moraniibacteriota bacterium]
MPKQKKSFFEKLTGIQKVDEDDEEIQVTNNPASFADREEFEEDQEEMYEFPEDGEDETQEQYDDFQESDFEDEYEDDYEEEPPKKQREPVNKAPVASEDENQADSEGQLTIDVYQNDREIVIKSTIAGVKPEDLDVNINDEMVTIKGKRDQGEEVDPENYYYQECYWGPFSRTIILPVEIVTDKAEALMKNGILTIKLPKAESTKTRKLQVRGF